MNPMDMKGPEFLVFYMVISTIMFLFIILIRKKLRYPNDNPDPSRLILQPIELAYLANGTRGILDALIAAMVHKNVMELDSDSKTVKLSAKTNWEENKDISDLLHPVEKNSEIKLGDLEKTITQNLSKTNEKLIDLGLVLADWQISRAKFISIILGLILLSIGMIKIGVGLYRQKPVDFLVFMVIVNCIIVYTISRKKLFRTIKGDKALTLEQKKHAALETQGFKQDMSGNDLFLGVGLFGTILLIDTPLSRLHNQLAANSDGSSADSGFSGSDGGGGDGGGSSCGGCGGGGGD